MQNSYIDTLLRGSSLKGRSSGDLRWQGLTIERRTAPPHERAEEILDRHYLVLWCGHPTAVERAYTPAKFSRFTKRPGTVSLGPAGILPAVRAFSPYDVVAAVIDPSEVDRIAAESDWSSSPMLHEHLGTGDPALVTLIRLAEREIEDGGAGGRLYGDSLCQAIISRFITVAQRERQLGNRVHAHALPKHSLRRVLTKIELEFGQDLSLSELATESGYSRAHFLRMFRAATGKTPHQHLKDVRLDYAQRQLLKGKRSIMEIAVAAGFSSHSHLTRAFRERFGVTPSAFRKNL